MNLDPQKNTPKDIATYYYQLLAGGARLRLLESLVNLEVLETLNYYGSLTEQQFIEFYKMSPKRAKKWLFLLVQEKFLVKKDDDTYAMGPVSRYLMGDNTSQWWFFKQMIYSWQMIGYEKPYEILKGKALSQEDINWPPKTKQDTVALEEWMTRTASGALYALVNTINFKTVNSMLDIGGGDGTIGCTLAQLNPKLQVTVFNLPEAVNLIEKKIDELGLHAQVHAYKGNFLTDLAFPQGFDLVLFSRVLCDWGVDKSTRCLKMAYDALNPGGRIVICEPFRDFNPDLSLVWEYRYMFWDNFDVQCFKATDVYMTLLENIGFKNITLVKQKDNVIYRVVTGVKQ